MRSNRVAGGVPSIIRKFRLTEGSPITLPPNCEVLYSELVTNDDDDLILEVWLAVPTVPHVNTHAQPSSGPQTIYTNTVVYEDEADEDELVSSFADEIEQGVSKNLSEYNEMEDDDGWNY